MYIYAYLFRDGVALRSYIFGPLGYGAQIIKNYIPRIMKLSSDV